MASPKYRDYMITINQGAESYENALDIIKELNTKLYALIVHDKDILQSENESGELVETPKKIHKHIVVELKNPISFDSMLKKFAGAHIEVIKYKKAAYQYLIHNRPNARDKYQYPLEDIISNSITSVKEAINAEEGIRVFKESHFLQYIVEGITTPYQFTKNFGLNVYKQYWKSYTDMVELSHTDTDMIEDIRKIKEEQWEADDLPF